MFKKTTTRAEGEITISTFEIKNKKERQRLCDLLLKTGKVFIIEQGFISDKYLSITEPLI